MYSTSKVKDQVLSTRCPKIHKILFLSPKTMITLFLKISKKTTI